MTQIFFTSDTHFDHSNIIHLAKRPFADLDEMNAALIDRWNAKVGSKDVVYHLGDFAFGDPTRASTFAKELNGAIHLIEGNHDADTVRYCRDNFASISATKDLSIDGQRLVLCHYPLREWNRAWRGSWHLFGHVHGRLDGEPHAKSLDVGVDSHNYAPIAFEEVAALMDARQSFADFAKPKRRAH